MPIAKSSFYKNTTFILAIYILAAAIACIVKISLDFKPHEAEGYISKVNNFFVYRNSFFHLLHHQNIYGYWPLEQYDEFLYSPTFALLFAPFALLPKYIGVVIWCIFNVVCVFIAVSKLQLESTKKTFIYWFILIELLTAVQNVQVNPIVCSLFIFAFLAFEKQKIGLAALCIVLSIYIKVFGVLGASMFLIYPNRLKFIVYGILWTIVLFALPLVAISFNELLVLYQNWFYTLTADHAKNLEDVSVMRMLAGISGIDFSEQTRLLIQVIAVLLFCFKYLRIKAYANQNFRYLFLVSAMIWSIIFNHAAESSTYIIAIAGVAIWYTTEQKSTLNLLLLLFAFVLCSLSPTDIFPATIRHNYIVPMALKSLPCFIIYLKLEYDLLFRKDFVTLEH